MAYPKPNARRSQVRQVQFSDAERLDALLRVVRHEALIVIGELQELPWMDTEILVDTLIKNLREALLRKD